MPSEPWILHRLESRDAGEVHHVTVNNPKKLNVLNSAVMEARAWWKEHSDDTGLRFR